MIVRITVNYKLNPRLEGGFYILRPGVAVSTVYLKQDPLPDTGPGYLEDIDLEEKSGMSQNIHRVVLQRRHRRPGIRVNRLSPPSRPQAAQVIVSEQPPTVPDITGDGIRMEAAYEYIQFFAKPEGNIKPSLQVYNIGFRPRQYANLGNVQAINLLEELLVTAEAVNSENQEAGPVIGHRHLGQPAPAGRLGNAFHLLPPVTVPGMGVVIAIVFQYPTSEYLPNPALYTSSAALPPVNQQACQKAVRKLRI